MRARASNRDRLTAKTLWALHSWQWAISRLAATPQLRIAAPDDALLAALLAKQFRDHGLRVGGDVVDYVLARIDRSFASIARIVNALDAAALAAGRPVTVPLARSVLQAQGDWLDTVMDL